MPSRSAARRAATLLTAVAFSFGLGLGALGGPGPMPLRAAGPAQGEVGLAGLVVQLEDGTLIERCVALGGAERTGLELLTLAGLAIAAESGPVGTLVCRIEGTGCDYPAEACWCRCRDLGADCRYWAYHTLEDGRWSYAVIGAAARRLRHGEVDGWAWGPGSVAGGAAPPLRSFEQLCAAQLAPSPTPAPSATPPRSSPTPTPARASATVAQQRASATPPAGRSNPRSPTAARLAGTPGATATFDPQAAPAAGAGATEDARAATARAAQRATLAAYPTVLASLLGTPGATLPPGSPPGAGTPAPVAPRTGGRELADARPVDPAAPPGDAAQEARGGSENSQAGSGDRGAVGYLVFALVIAALGIALVALRRRPA